MRLNSLLSGVEIIKSKVDDREIKYIASDSRKVKDSYIFVALKGKNRNGNDYIKEAIKNGCTCIITDDSNVFYEYENVVLTYNIGIQAFLNIAVVTDLVPNTGISLPFFSYGGSSLVILMCEMGIILSISKRSIIRTGV